MSTTNKQCRAWKTSLSPVENYRWQYHILPSFIHCRIVFIRAQKKVPYHSHTLLTLSLINIHVILKDNCHVTSICHYSSIQGNILIIYSFTEIPSFSGIDCEFVTLSYTRLRTVIVSDPLLRSSLHQ